MANIECDLLGEDTFPLRGSVRTVMLAKISGKVPVLDFFKTLDAKQEPQVGALLARASDSWPIRNREHCHKIEGAIHELKKHQVRLLFYEKLRHIILVHGLFKKKADLRPEDVRRALEVMEKHEQQFDWTTMTYKEER